MSKLTTCEMVVARANNRPSQEELIKDYYSYGKIGKEIIKMINQFDDLNPHDQLAKDYIKEYYKFLKKVSSSRIQINKWIELINSLQSETSWIEYKFSDNSSATVCLFKDSLYSLLYKCSLFIRATDRKTTVPASITAATYP